MIEGIVSSHGALDFVTGISGPGIRVCGDHPIDLVRYQVANCYMGRAGLINSGGSSGKNDLAQAVRTAVEERLEREERLRSRPSVEHVMAIARRYASRPVIDDRSPDEIIGYDERGLPR
jgi:hypothetical protein